MSHNDAIADEIDRGADEIERYGWYNARTQQGAGSGPQVCAFLAIDGRDAVDAFELFVGGHIPTWNDVR